MLTLPVPSLLAPTPYTKGEGGGSAGPPAISKTVAPINLKFCRVLEPSFNVLELLKLFTHSNSSKERCFIGKTAENTNIQIAAKFTILMITL